MSPEELKAKNTQFVEAVFRNHDLTRLEDFLAPEYLLHDTQPPIKGPDGYRQAIQHFLTAFPDVDYKVEDFFVSGDRAVTRWSWRATHRGPWWGVSGTGKVVNTMGVTVSIVNAQGKVIDEWVNWDAHGLLEQFGRVPNTNQVTATL